MIRSMYSGISGMVNHQTRMDVISNNIANVNTTGFKAGRASFKDALYMALDAAGQEKGTFQVGTGTSVSGILNVFTQGPLEATGRNLDLGIYGPGFFGVKDEDSEDLRKFTRDGTLFIDQEGHLVTSSGLNVVNRDGEVITIELEDDQSVEDITISEDGEIFVGGESEDEFIGLFKFENEWALTRIGDNLFLENDNTGERFARDDDNEDGFGTIHSGFLEMSNINLAQELTNLITTQRGYQANAKVFATADEVLREVIELKR